MTDKEKKAILEATLKYCNRATVGQQGLCYITLLVFDDMNLSQYERDEFDIWFDDQQPQANSEFYRDRVNVAYWFKRGAIQIRRRFLKHLISKL